MKKEAFKPITINPKTVCAGAGGGAIEILAGAELSADDVDLLVSATIKADMYLPVLLLLPGGFKQHLQYSELETLLAEPLAVRRAEIAAERAQIAAEQEKAWEAAEALRKQQAADQATKEAAQVPALEAIG